MATNPLEHWIETSRVRVESGEFSLDDLEALEGLLTKPKQKILYLLSRRSDMQAKIVSWQLCDPGSETEPTLPSPEPPYASVIDAVRDGWRILQFPSPQSYPFTEQNSYVGYEFVLERFDRS
jgi:hypothetical protein